MKNDPIETAKHLIAKGCSIKQYESIQDERRERLSYWTDHGIDYLIERESVLLKFGDKVLKAMRELK